MVAQRQSNVLAHRQIMKKLSPFEDQRQAQPMREPMLLKDRHFFTQKVVIALQWRHQAGGGHQKVTFPRALQASYHPVIARRHTPGELLDHAGYDVAQRPDVDTLHVNYRYGLHSRSHAHETAR